MINRAEESKEHNPVEKKKLGVQFLLRWVYSRLSHPIVFYVPFTNYLLLCNIYLGENHVTRGAWEIYAQ